MFLHHAADCATIVKRLLLSRLQSRNLSMYMILDINENNRKPSNDGLRLFHLFRTGSAPGGSFRFPIRWSPSDSSFDMVLCSFPVERLDVLFVAVQEICDLRRAGEEPGEGIEDIERGDRVEVGEHRVDPDHAEHARAEENEDHRPKPLAESTRGGGGAVHQAR